MKYASIFVQLSYVFTQCNWDGQNSPSEMWVHTTDKLNFRKWYTLLVNKSPLNIVIGAHKSFHPIVIISIYFYFMLMHQSNLKKEHSNVISLHHMKYILQNLKGPYYFNWHNCIEQNNPLYFYFILTSLLVASSACTAWAEFNAYWLKELGGSQLLVENTPILLLLHMGLLEPKMGEKSTPADPPELSGRRLLQGRQSH